MVVSILKQIYRFCRYASLSSSWSNLCWARVKGNTATNATKSATVETGASVNVPLFIEGDKIKIDTASGSWNVLRNKQYNC
jgi:hypothetical protein